MPWAIDYEGRTFVVATREIATALEEIQAFLLPDVISDMRRDMEDEYRQRYVTLVAP